jgi:hypothetical protein
MLYPEISAADSYVSISSAYSAHEHYTLYSNVARSAASSSSSTSSSYSASDLPLDITIETLVAVALVSVGLVLGAEKLKPITWSAWAGEVEREGGWRNPYRGLDQRIGFWDVRVSFDQLLLTSSLGRDLRFGRVHCSLPSLSIYNWGSAISVA